MANIQSSTDKTKAKIMMGLAYFLMYLYGMTLKAKKNAITARITERSWPMKKS